MFLFSENEFIIKEAYLDAYVLEHGPTLVWGFEISGEREELCEEDYGPLYVKVSIHNSPEFTSPKGSISKWQDIIGTRVELKNNYEDEPDVLIYIGEHVELVNGYFEIYRSSDNQVKIKIEGECDSIHGYSKKLEVDVPIIFKGILFGRKKKKTAMSILSNILDVKDYTFIQDSSGVSLCKPKRNITRLQSLLRSFHSLRGTRL